MQLSEQPAAAQTARNPLLAYPATLPSLAKNMLAECQAIVILVDPDQTSQPPVKALQVAFTLSDAEARLAARLAAGETLEVAAAHFGIAKETGRNQLKNIFAKTGVHRQAELVALLGPLLNRITTSKHTAFTD